MSQPASDPFVPFHPIPASAAKSSPAPVGLKVVPKTESTPAFSPLQTIGGGQRGEGGRETGLATSALSPHRSHLPEPVVILQRDGDRVTGIRIECACGQVIELACSY